MFSIFASPEAWVSLITLTGLEVVLGIDNIVFISILAGKLPAEEQAKARRLGLGVALGSRLLLLFAISWVMGLNKPLLPPIMGVEITGRSLILLVGGLFLIAKATKEIFDKLEVEQDAHVPKGRATLSSVIVQIMLLDIVFSLDSVITAVGMVPHIIIMVLAMVIAVAVMMIFAAPVGNFVERHPSMKILALSFLLLVGVLLTAEALGQHVNKGYIYFAMAFSLAVELVNMRLRKKQAPVALHQVYEGDR